MSQRKGRGRHKGRRTASLGTAQAKRTNIVLAEGEHQGMYFTLYGLDDQDVAEARAACAAGCPNEGAFLVVFGLFEALGLDAVAWCEWPMDEKLDLFAMVGLPVRVWPGDMDSDLARLLSGAAS
ncbi:MULTISPECIES: hypothetical protein [Streptomyces]|uniref:Uncharacterized protein n=1 Tax=Streptomyces dengpaensis TaxID=2049881 RepID=A0ABN5I439_9ACTN|nr:MULTISPECIES: hypothetical protein [Streptomyces]AVH57780.1 hypothetical protein C4B68_20650 [Streptomyces dengpaensis]PIB03497.1 hypothetical protein B1C81_37010 [Streptomyces sp. HG99]